MWKLYEFCNIRLTESILNDLIYVRFCKFYIPGETFFIYIFIDKTNAGVQTEVQIFIFCVLILNRNIFRMYASLFYNCRVWWILFVSRFINLNKLHLKLLSPKRIMNANFFIQYNTFPVFSLSFGISFCRWKRDT